MEDVASHRTHSCPDLRRHGHGESRYEDKDVELSETGREPRKSIPYGAVHVVPPGKRRTDSHMRKQKGIYRKTNRKASGESEKIFSNEERR
jgi:hypothetical protein